MNLAPLRERFLAAQLRGDRREAVRLVATEGRELGATVSQLQEEVVRKAQQEIGELWQRSAITIAEEHMATAIANVALARLYECAERRPSNGKCVVVACVEGELHDFPARLVADALDLVGFEVRYLGANVPTEHLMSLLQKKAPDLLALSATMSFNVTSLRHAVETVRAAMPTLPIAVGGGACVWASRLSSDLETITAGSASELVTLVEQALL